MQINRKVFEKGPKKYLLKSTDTFLIEDYLTKLRNAFSDYQYCLCADVESFCDVCNSGALFGSENRVIVLYPLEKEALETIVSFAETPSDDLLVFVEVDPLLKNKAYTSLASLCTPISLKPPTDSERSAWVRGWLTDAGLSFPDEIPGYIVTRSGFDLCGLKNEIKKLSILLFMRGTKAVTQSVCDELIADNHETQLFVLMENFFRKKISEVMVEFRKFDEYSYVKLVHFMIGQVERAYKVAIFKEQGMTAEQVGEIIGVPSFIVKTKLFTILSFYSKLKLLQLLDIFNRLDVELRTTKYPKNTVFEYYLVRGFKL